jgi:hypothetical protein
MPPISASPWLISQPIIGCGYFEVEPLIDRPAIALRTLDALHLAIA